NRRAATCRLASNLARPFRRIADTPRSMSSSNGCQDRRARRSLSRPRPQCARFLRSARRPQPCQFHRPIGYDGPPMDLLTAFGLAAVSLMLVFYAVEDKSHWFVLAFAGSCLMGSSYGFLQGAWPFGIVELIWSGIAIRKWWKRQTIIGDADARD